MEDKNSQQSYTAFEGARLLRRGPLSDVVLAVRRRKKDEAAASILIFSDLTGKEMDFDLRGSERDVLQRLQVYLSSDGSMAVSAPNGPGRPKLGVVAREVSLLPRQWEWLSTQSGGASATLRRLVEEARKTASSGDLVKQAQERTYKFMTAMAGDLPNYEEALRALYAKDQAKFRERTARWPKDIREYSRWMATPVFR